MSVLQALNRECIVKVFGIGRVDGESGGIAHIAAASNFFLRNHIANFIGSLFHILRIHVGQAEFRHYGIDFGIVAPGFTQHIHHLSDRAIGIFGPFNDAHHRLVAGVAALQFVVRNKDIGG